MKRCISHDSTYSHREEYYNEHPHMPIIKIDFYQLDKQSGEPTKRHPRLVPNRIVVQMNDLVDRTIDFDHNIISNGQTIAQPILLN